MAYASGDFLAENARKMKTINWPKHLYSLDVSRGIAASSLVFLILVSTYIPPKKS